MTSAIHRTQQKLYHSIVILFLYGLLAPCTQAETPTPTATNSIAIVAPPNTTRKNLLTLLQQEMNNYQWKVLDPQQLGQQNLENYRYVVTLGHKSLNAVRSQPHHPPVIATYLSQMTTPELQPKPDETLLYTSADWQKQLTLALQLLPQAKTVGVLISPALHQRLAPLLQAAAQQGLQVQIAEWDGRDSLPKTLNELLKQADFILAVEDATIFNSSTIKTILLTSYRRNKVIIGPNPAYVKAGSLASVYCDDKTVVHAIKMAIEAPTPSGNILCDNIRINEQVARSLLITIPQSLQQGRLTANEDGQ